MAQASSFAGLAARVKPAVVNIATVGKRTQAEGHKFEGPRFPPPSSPFEEYFRRFLEPQSEGNRHGSAPSEVRALGSGFIIDAGGLVVTNNHVIESADEIIVVLDAGTRYPATLRGHDAKTDLALLEIKADSPFLTCRGVIRGGAGGGLSGCRRQSLRPWWHGYLRHRFGARARYSIGSFG